MFRKKSIIMLMLMLILYSCNPTSIIIQKTKIKFFYFNEPVGIYMLTSSESDNLGTVQNIGDTLVYYPNESDSILKYITYTKSKRTINKLKLKLNVTLLVPLIVY